MHLAGDGLCAEIEPKIFEMHDDGLAYVKQEQWPNRYGPDGSGSDPALQMADGMADVPEHLLETVIESSEECPGECIFLQICE